MRNFFYLTLFSFVTIAHGMDAVADQVWEKIQLPKAVQERNLQGVYFVDAKHGWIVGDKGLCLTTNDGGTTWKPKETSSKATLRGVQFKDTQTGWVCGDGDTSAPDVELFHGILGAYPLKPGTLLHTTNGGNTWKTSWIPTNFQIHCIEASEAPLIQVGSNGGSKLHLDGDFLRSTANGKTGTWTLDNVGGACCRSISALRMIEGKRWVAVGAANSGILDGDEDNKKTFPLWDKPKCRALYSDDSGKTWKFSKGSDGKLDSELLALAVAKNHAILAVGDEGVILRSQDSGVTWEQVKSPTKTVLVSVAWSGPLAIALGRNGTIVVGTEDGKNWEVMSTEQTQALRSMTVAGDYLIAVGKKGTALRAKVIALTNSKKTP